jgi:magnesium chelatase family protein
MPAVWSAAPFGDRCRVLSVSGLVEDEPPEVLMHGVPYASTRELRDRVRAAILNSGLRWPTGKVTVTVDPACAPARVSVLDLAVTVAVLAAGGSVPAVPAENVMFFAEVGLDGQLRPVPGVPAAATTAAEARCRAIVVAASDVGYATQVPGLEVNGARSLAEVVALLRAAPEIASARGPQPRTAGQPGHSAARQLAGPDGRGDLRGRRAQPVGQWPARGWPGTARRTFADDPTPPG